MKKVEKKSQERVVIEGVVVSAKYGSSKFDDNNKYRISINSDNIPYDDITAYDNVGQKMTPSWFKDRDGYINLASIYTIPVMDASGQRIDFDEWLERGTAIGSTVKVPIKQKDGAIYPQAIKVIEEGEPFDPFEGLSNIYAIG